MTTKDTNSYYGSLAALAGLSESRGLFGLDALPNFPAEIPPPPRPTLGANRNALLSEALLQQPRGLPGLGMFAMRDYARMLQQSRNTAHDTLVKRLINYLRSNLYGSISADLEGWSKPTKIVWQNTQEGHIPDARAVRLGKEYIFEVETADTISIDHTHDQCRLFAAYADQHGGEFVLVVPAGYQVAGLQQMNEWRLRGYVLQL